MSSTDAEAPAPRFRGPWSYLGWLVRRQWPRVVLGALLGTVWMVGLAVPPYLLSRAVDALADADRTQVLAWAAALVGSGVVLAWLGIWRHRTMTKVRMDAAFRTVSVLSAQSIRLGATQERRGRAGEVVAIGNTDSWTLGRSLTVTGPGVGAVVAYLVIAVLLLQISTLLAVVVLCGVPFLALILGPALGPLQAAGTRYRQQQGALTGRIVDVIDGLSVLNGLGGKKLYADRVRRESHELQQLGYQVGRVTSLVQATGLGVPTLFLAVVVWLAARLAVQGEISVGELVAVFGYAAVLAAPVFAFIEGAVDLSRALVAGRRVTEFLSVQRGDDDATTPVPASGHLVDAITGLEVEAGTFTVIAASRQADAVALVDRLGGLRAGATWDGRSMTDVDPGELRRHVLVADNDAVLFAGSLGEVVAGARDVDEEAVLGALHVAAADDLVRGQPDGLATRIDSRGRNLSGGQRQRVRLARAVMATPEVLLAVDPTSAVDAATEASVVERLIRARQGRTTVVTSTSVLMLAAADRVHVVAGNRLVASGTHPSLLRDDPDYAALVLRGERPDAIEADDGGAP